MTTRAWPRQRRATATTSSSITIEWLPVRSASGLKMDRYELQIAAIDVPADPLGEMMDVYGLGYCTAAEASAEMARGRSRWRSLDDDMVDGVWSGAAGAHGSARGAALVGERLACHFRSTSRVHRPF